jgi:hypothetical protein
LDRGRLAPHHRDNHVIGDLSALGAARIDDIADGRYGVYHGLPLVEVSKADSFLTALNENSPTKYS